MAARSFRRSSGERRLFCFRFQWSNLTLFVNSTSIMTTFREVRHLLAVACFEDIIDEDEFLLLWDLHDSKNLDFPYEDYGRFDLDEMDDSECLAEFRVKKRDLPDLAAALQIPNQFACAIVISGQWPMEWRDSVCCSDDFHIPVDTQIRV